MDSFEVRFTEFIKHLDARLDRIESALSVLNSDNKRNSERIAEHNILIQQNKTDLDSLGRMTREAEMNCQLNNAKQHEELYKRIGEAEKQMSFYKGAVVLIPFILSGIYFFITLYLGEK